MGPQPDANPDGTNPDATQTPGLLDAIRRGDRAAVNDLLERHRASLRRMIGLRLDRQLARRVDASDVVQDVLLEANERLEAYLQNPGIPFHLWLRQIAKDRVIDMHRRHRRAARRSLDREQPLPGGGEDNSQAMSPGEAFADHELTPAAENIRREFEERMLLALDRLDDDERDLILMRHFEQLGNQEVAQALGLTPAAAGMRHLRALRRLRDILGHDFLLGAPPAEPKKDREE